MWGEVTNGLVGSEAAEAFLAVVKNVFGAAGRIKSAVDIAFAGWRKLRACAIGAPAVDSVFIGGGRGEF